MWIRTLTAVTCAAVGLSACAPGPWLDKSRLQDDLDAKQSTETYPVQVITADVIMKQVAQVRAEQASSLPSDLSKWDYKIGPDDIIGVTVYDHPELSTTSPTAAPESNAGAPPLPQVAGAAPSDQAGHRVGSDGTIFFPTLGRVKLAGLTIEQARETFAKLLAKNVRDPQVDIRVIAYRSQRIQMTGEVKSPGTMAVTDVPLTLIDAITRAGGETPAADMSRVHLTRHGETIEIDAQSILEHGRMRENVLLEAGDVVNVPDRSDARIFAFGEVGHPQMVPIPRAGLTLADALAAVQSIDPKGADPRQIYVIRGAADNPQKPVVFRLDMTQVDALLLQTQFALHPLDVLYVGTSGAVRFNRVLDQITPALSTLFYTKALVDPNNY
ncbi:polysaccharide biosynthesis/export family protein [Pararobbsia silviterrae]|uniref:Exopolysaccharide biosynthesis protein n=1 Tax=Pararobbsia silviterrae TaxID=1792498 RepID=A0A494X6R1_9BURK|nr:polysaccharide biosynthesis/export family protein [Pararobbsia silviterrae]RKP45321.1 exopolysaccharide biosynthesis protein [Pararobbsia silviterrae]